MNMIGRCQDVPDIFRHVKVAGGAVADVEDKIPCAILAIPDEGAAGRAFAVDVDRAGVDAIIFQPADVHAAEIVVAHGRNDRDRVTKFGHLVGENCWST